MKKLNKKGFTLIELLAVIVVLAIVMVIAVTSVLNSTTNAAINSLNSSALTVADFVKGQEALYTMGGGNSETCYDTWRNAHAGNGPLKIDNEAAAKCFGLNIKDYDEATSTVSFSGNNVTVSLCAKTGGKFANVTSITGIDVTSSLAGTSTNSKCVEATK